jgi:hypothetical protein
MIVAIYYWRVEKSCDSVASGVATRTRVSLGFAVSNDLIASETKKGPKTISNL